MKIARPIAALIESFQKLPGVGPKSALGVLSLASPDTLAQAISTNDTDYLTKVSGIGRKLAEKIVLELKNKKYLKISFWGLF